MTNNKIKAGLSILLLAAVFFMMVETPFTGAFGDYILEFIGLRPWSGDHSGSHLTVIYFGVVFLLVLHLVKVHAVEGLNLRIRTVFIIFIVLVVSFSAVTNEGAKLIKGNSSGLSAIGFNSSGSSLTYHSENSQYVEFAANFTLTNYSPETKTFHIIIDKFSSLEEGHKDTEVLGLDGKPAVFDLRGKESKPFEVNMENYHFRGGIETLNESGYGIIKGIVLYDDQGNIIRLDNKNFFGILLGN